MYSGLFNGGKAFGLVLWLFGYVFISWALFGDIADEIAGVK